MKRQRRSGGSPPDSDYYERHRANHRATSRGPRKKPTAPQRQQSLPARRGPQSFQCGQQARRGLSQGPHDYHGNLGNYVQNYPLLNDGQQRVRLYSFVVVPPYPHSPSYFPLSSFASLCGGTSKGGFGTRPMPRAGSRKVLWPLHTNVSSFADPC